MTDALNKLYWLLEEEAKFWEGSASKNMTPAHIRKFQMVVGTLYEYVEAKKVIEFILVFEDEDISVTDVRRCFRSAAKRKVKAQRDTANDLLRDVCDHMINLLKGDAREKLAKTGRINVESAERRFRGFKVDLERYRAEDEDAETPHETPSSSSSMDEDFPDFS